MSKADVIFKNMCEDIISSNISTAGAKVRPHWEDGTPAYTIKKFGVCNRYDLQEEFPAITFRKTAIKTATKELLWIYRDTSNNIHDLDAHIWDEWASEDGSIGKAYGYQIGQKYIHHTADSSTESDYPSLSIQDGFVLMNQIDGVIYDLQHTPYSRRIMTNMYNFNDLHEMNLYPCAYSCTFNVTDDGYDKLRLNLLLNQRSNDVLAANNWNVCQYAVLLMMIAQVCDMIPGELVHMIADAHIYDRHVDLVKELITREQHNAPTVTLNQDIKRFHDFTIEDLHIENYITGPQITNIPIAI